MSVEGDDANYVEPLYRATSMLEAARLRSIRSPIGFAAVSATAWLSLASGIPSPGWRCDTTAVATSLLVASWVVCLVDFDAYRRLLRTSSVERGAALVSRRLDDLGIPNVRSRLVGILVLGGINGLFATFFIAIGHEEAVHASAAFVPRNQLNLWPRRQADAAPLPPVLQPRFLANAQRLAPGGDIDNRLWAGFVWL